MIAKIAICMLVATTYVNAQVNRNLYHEKHREQIHFSPSSGWMNDPNGMVYYEGEYHLFYQHYPKDNKWGPMHWGHAVSKDMIHWNNLPIALYPDSLGYIFSGSAVIDWKNTSGFAKNNRPAMVAIFTYHNAAEEKKGKKDYQSQGIAYSNDKGRTWTKFKANPVIKNPGISDFRDPKMSWDNIHNQWILALAVQDHTEFWTSKNLKNWEHASDFGKEWGAHGGVWECPDFFPLKVDGTKETKWILLKSINPGAINGGSGTQYFVGDFDGKNFILDEKFKPFVRNNEAVWLDYGRDNYAGVTWSDIPAKDGRRLFIGWMSNWQYAQNVPTAEWRSTSTLPRELVLKSTEAGYRLFTNPVKETALLKEKGDVHKLLTLQEQTLEGALDLTPKPGFTPTLSELNLSFELPEASQNTKFRVELSNDKGESYSVGYDAAANHFFSDRTQSGDLSFSDRFAAKVHPAPRTSRNKTIEMRLFFDVASSELFADKGETVITDIFFPTTDFTHLKLIAEGGKVILKKGSVQQLKSIWK
ncbi:fructan beta-fructosidase [Pseudarcicella hirudinis]|uniref:Fructan beta-fructosidase n=2 Tax=Pseudarcicella hirudinis TaxID=1079859 RepID=A0A1I5RGK4_9BACT|nr:fructan beta-fructosidase [Pseudarcicella hirudinis]